MEEGLPIMANMQAQEYEAVSLVPEGPRVALPLDNIPGAWWMVEPSFRPGWRECVWRKPHLLVGRILRHLL